MKYAVFALFICAFTSVGFSEETDSKMIGKYQVAEGHCGEMGVTVKIDTTTGQSWYLALQMDEKGKLLGGFIWKELKNSVPSN